MAINFFKENCLSKTNETVFGIYDAPPATLSFVNSEEWIVWVDNENSKEINHVAIDDCLDIHKSEGERCDSMITYDDVLTFIELKDRSGGRWAGKARDQLANTIALFKRDVGIAGYKKLYGHIANKQRPIFNSGGKSFSQKFEDETGFILRVSGEIKIE
ncbi:MAG: hypothetical protein RBR87_04475 [Bacteroidales bacterium]|jgi:hypothetical protein|nr:hypothetical protein [Bacteroidales bacterium]